MATLASSKRSEELFRKKLLEMLVGDFGYPKELIVIEKKLSELPHLETGAKTPNRRIDILCYKREKTGLSPYLLIECKAVPLQEKMKRQVIGYNYYVGARFIALCSPKEQIFGDGHGWETGLPLFTRVEER